MYIHAKQHKKIVCQSTFTIASLVFTQTGWKLRKLIVGVSKEHFCPILGGYTTLAVQQSDVSFVVICPSWLLHNSAGPRPGQSFFCPCSGLCLPALMLA